MTKPSLNFALGDRLVGYFPAFDEFIWGKLGRIVNESGIAVYFLLPDDGSVPRNFIRGEGLGKTTREAVLSSRWWLRIHRSSAIAQARDSIAEAGTYDVQLRTIEERFETDNWS